MLNKPLDAIIDNAFISELTNGCERFVEKPSHGGGEA